MPGGDNILVQVTVEDIILSEIEMWEEAVPQGADREEVSSYIEQAWAELLTLWRDLNFMGSEAEINFDKSLDIPEEGDDFDLTLEDHNLVFWFQTGSLGLMESALYARRWLGVVNINDF